MRSPHSAPAPAGPRGSTPPGEADPCATGDLRGAPADDRREPERLKRLAHAAQVPHAVVDDPDGLPACHPKTPFDECTPFTLESMRTASDMGLPNPFEYASTVWWALELPVAV